MWESLPTRLLSSSFVVLLLVVAGLGTAPRAGAETVVPIEGAWSAKASNGLPVYFEVIEGKVVNASFFFKQGFCGGSGAVGSNEDPIDASGHWFYSTEGFIASEPYVEGTFVTPGMVEGKVIAPTREFPGCPGTTATFVATPTALPIAERTVVAIEDELLQTFHSRPDGIILRQGGRSFLLEELRWKPYGGRVAVAHGYFHTKGFNPKKAPAVTVRLLDRIAWGNFLIYRVLRFEVHGPVPDGFRRSGRRTVLSTTQPPKYQPVE